MLHQNERKNAKEGDMRCQCHGTQYRRELKEITIKGRFQNVCTIDMERRLVQMAAV